MVAAHHPSVWGALGLCYFCICKMSYFSIHMIPFVLHPFHDHPPIFLSIYRSINLTHASGFFIFECAHSYTRSCNVGWAYNSRRSAAKLPSSEFHSRHWRDHLQQLRSIAAAEDFGRNQFRLLQAITRAPTPRVVFDIQSKSPSVGIQTNHFSILGAKVWTSLRCG